MLKFSRVCLVPVICLIAAPLWAAATVSSPVTPDPQLPPPQAPEVLEVSDKQQKREARLSLEAYQEIVDQLEQEEGAYGARLSQPLLSLGLSLQENNQHTQAIDVFKRAMHINRINEGLYNLNQVEILEPLIKSYIARRDWKRVGKRYDYLYWLLRRNTSADDPRLLPMIYKLSGWYLDSFNRNASVDMSVYLLHAHDLYKLAADIIGDQFGRHDLRMINALRGLAVSNYYLATNTMLHDDEPTTNNNGFVEHAPQQKYRLASYINKSFSNGVKAINRMVNIYAANPEAPALAHEKALVELGDWYLRFNKRESAFRVYQQAYDQMVAHETSTEEINRLFGWPVALSMLYHTHHQLGTPPRNISMQQVPKYGAPVVLDAKGEPQTAAVDSQLQVFDTLKANPNEPPAPLPDELNLRYVIVSFDVTPTGKTRNIEVVSSNPSNAYSIRSKARDYLKVTRFRPRFAEGGPVLTQQVTHRYLFPSKK